MRLLEETVKGMAKQILKDVITAGSISLVTGMVEAHIELYKEKRLKDLELRLKKLEQEVNDAGS